MMFWFAALLSLVGVAGIRRLARTRLWIDIPNQRSSHERPTPTGGGLAIAAVLVVLTPWCWSFSLPQLVYLLGVTVLALVGLGDDLQGVAARYRFLLHLAVAGVAAFAISRGENAGGFFCLVAFCLVASLINIYNFMDGIDGLAGLEGLLAGVFISWLLAGGFSGKVPVPTEVFTVIAGACAGFLCWNFPWRRRATIFMGDTGSTVLGFAFAYLLALAAGGQGKLLLALCLPLANFLVDGGLTLLLRLRDGEKLSQPHRRHLYQRLVAAGCSHRRVAAGEGVAVFLGYLVARGLLHGPAFRGWLLAGSYLLLLVLTWVRLRRWASRKLTVAAPE